MGVLYSRGNMLPAFVGGNDDYFFVFAELERVDEMTWYDVDQMLVVPWDYDYGDTSDIPGLAEPTFEEVAAEDPVLAEI